MKQGKYFNKADRLKLKMLIKEKTGYFIKSDYVLSQAFRRRSFCAEYGGKSNEMFEFIGDQVISYYATKIITDHCVSFCLEGDYSFRIRENHFTSLKQELVCNEAFAEIIDQWDISSYMLIGKSDEKNKISQQTNVKADLFEAIIGAIAFDSKWNPEVLEDTIKKALNLDERIQSLIQSDYNSITFTIDNAVSTLKELAEKEICSIPNYRFREPNHFVHDKDGNPIWHCSCSIINDITGICFGVFASSKKDAKKAAAYLVLCEHFQIANQYGDVGYFPNWVYMNGKLMHDKESYKIENFLANN